MNTVVSYCLSNVDAETRALLRQSGLQVFEDHCLQRCGDCLLGPFLLLGETMVQGETHEAILEQVRAILRAHEEQSA